MWGFERYELCSEMIEGAREEVGRRRRRRSASESENSNG